MEPLRLRQAPQDSRVLQNQPTSSADSPSEEVAGDTDEPPDGKQLANMKQEQPFKKIHCQLERKQSLLTQTLHVSDSESDSSFQDEDEDEDEDVFSPSTRAHSSASNWSRGSFASTADLTSDGQTTPSRTRSPSPPSPRIRLPMSPTFNMKPFAHPATIKIVENGVDPRISLPVSANEDKVEAGLGRKRCIMFACGKKEEPKVIKIEEPKPVLPAKRPCALTFACPTKTPASTNTNKPHIRISSPAPTKRMPQSPKPSLRSHRGSDATVRTTSPRTVHKVPSVVRARRSSNASDADQYEATRFHEFASSEEERDDWMQEQTCHRSRLTVDDTLKVENTLRKLGKEMDEEVLEEEEEEELDQGLGNEEDDVDEDDDDDDNDSIGMVDSTGYLTDEGFQTDDEEGFAGSDDDSDSDGSDFAWWAPAGGHSGGDHIVHIRSSRPRSDSGSSIGSFSSTKACPAKSGPNYHNRKVAIPREFRPRTPELPDSTDFVCGTLDEDRPLEHAYYSCLQQRRAAKHVPQPQDIDPTFPISDNEMDEEDEDSENEFHVDESDHHLFMHGAPDASDSEARQRRGVTLTKRSPHHSPKRLRSPPPAKRTAYHSPPPRRLKNRSPPPTTRYHSPPPMNRHWSPPSTVRHHSPPLARLRSPAPMFRRPSFLKHMEELNATPIALHGTPKSGKIGTSSIPRNGVFSSTRPTIENMAMQDEDAEDGEDVADTRKTRHAIDIVKGLEKKRLRRLEKMKEKNCRMRAKGSQKKHAHHVLPGKGAERMREMGLELAALRGKKPVGSPTEQRQQHILSY
ncbi:hypothetical protein E2P81_ATG05614 [Venturia nashicola]|uniref:Uncharacterized protein n=1 Tax=Venturia nashicola TaxID=86259 RepID=A0A4Z1P8G5_9PEZI|nr:hypothetical protein E6O75_ATG05751 [Venturia nashicola]TLD32638.1 hypothetical protein E2P81_ATG05614 [Venturia nashicola]